MSAKKRLPARRLLRLGVALGLAVTAACGETGVNQPLAAGSITVPGGLARTGVAGRPLAQPIEVVVLGTDNQPLPRVDVTFAASGDGAVAPATATTDANGVARTVWTLSRAAGASTLTVTAAGITSTITAQGAAGPAAAVAMAAGDNQTAEAGTAVAVAPSVRVVDAFGNPVQGARVSFSVLAGGGRLTDFVRTTDAQGRATLGAWDLGAAAGTQTVLARVEESGVANNPVVFSATATPVVATQLVVAAGNGQSAQINRAVATAPTVVVRDARGNPVAGVVVTFAAASGGGTVVGGRQVTDATGTASVGAWFLGGTPGANTLTASAPGVQPVVFTATASPGVAVTMTPNAPTTQPGVASQPVPAPPSVVVRDFSGNPVAGVTVTFTVTAGGGSVIGATGGTGATSAQVTTDASGVATLAAWTLGTAIVTNTVVASAPGLPSVTFTATPTAGTPATVLAAAGQNGAAVQGTSVATPPAVRVTDANGNPVGNAEVVFAVTGGQGTITGATQRTDAAGVATVGSWTLGGSVPNTLSATVAGANVTNNPIVFTAQSASRIALTAVPAGPLNRNESFTVTAQLQNLVGDPVSLAGVPLSIAITTGDGTLSGVTTALTDATGTATFTVSLGGAAGSRTFTVSASSLPIGAQLAPATTAAITFN